MPRPAPAGSSYVYAARGYVVLELSQGSLTVDWRAAEPPSEGQQPLVLPEGSNLTLSVASTPISTLDLYGRQRQAFQVTTWAERADTGSVLPAGDQRIDATTGELVWRASRSMIAANGKVQHFATFGMRHRPGLLLAPVFWNESLHTGDRGAFTHLAQVVAGGGPVERHNATYEVAGVYLRDGVCHADIAVDPGFPRAVSERIELTLTSEHSVPVRYVQVYKPSVLQAGRDFGFAFENLEMSLDEVHRGLGPPLPPFEPEPLVENRTVLPRARLDEGFLAARGGVFPTDFDEALAAIRNESEARTWLERHPDARPTQVTHRLGRPGSRVIDEWDVKWSEPGGSGLRTTATKERRDLVIIEEEAIEVQTAEEGPDAYPNEVPDWPTMKALVDVHRTVYRTQPEFLQCWTSEAKCWVGTHAATGTPYVGESGTSIPGIVVDMDRGWVVQEQSWDPGPLGPPVPRP